MADIRAPRQNHAIEGLRFLAALGIVWFHMQAPGQPYAYAALAVFLALTADLSAGALERGSLFGFWAKRFWRIAVPWVAWSAFYFAMRKATGLEAPEFWSDWRVFLIGPEIHLWFLPFVLIASMLVMIAQAWISLNGGINVLLAVFVALASVSLILHHWAGFDAPFAQWTFALPPFLLGLVMAHARRSGQDWAEPAFLFATMGITLAAGASDGLLQLLIAWPVLWVVWRLPLRNDWLPRLGALAFGIYLIHPFLALVLFKFAPGLESTVAGVVILFAASALAVAVMRRVPVLRAVV